MSFPSIDPPRASSRSPHAGLYSPFNLRWIYTSYVIRLSHPLLWGIANHTLRALYRTSVGARHVEVGPGNGYFLRRLPSSTPLREVDLIDVHPGPLQVTQSRLQRRFAVRPHRRDALAAWPLADASADSVAASMVLHTLADPLQRGIAAKETLFAEAARVLRPGGCFVGATVLTGGPGVRPRWAARRAMAAYQARGWLSNRADTSDGLQRLLAEHFGDRVRLRIYGCVGVWKARAGGGR